MPSPPSLCAHTASPLVRLPRPCLSMHSHNPTMGAQIHMYLCAMIEVVCTPCPMVSPQNTHGTSLLTGLGKCMQLWELEICCDKSPEAKAEAVAAAYAWLFPRGETSHRRRDAPGLSRRCCELSRRRPGMSRRHFSSVAETRLNCRGDTTDCRGDISHLSRRHRGLSRRHFSCVAETSLSCRGDTSKLSRRHARKRQCRGDTSKMSRRQPGRARSSRRRGVGSRVSRRTAGAPGLSRRRRKLSRRHCCWGGCRGDSWRRGDSSGPSRTFWQNWGGALRRSLTWGETAHLP